ncbi:hypothetical protein C8F01DRAFT_1242771 [Mycena amicta]|nr:hypothetical protein C8F01DRAFT_1242771 [Mycena amicta]
MLPLSLILLLLLPNASATHGQTPLLAELTENWNLNTPPSPNATGNLVFNTISSLLQHWPNTRYHSGHTIVPGVIPPGTLLFHARSDPQVPTAREWASTDPEFARIFCQEQPEECWLLTLVTVRPLRMLYFDGSSATKRPDGPMDTQDLIAWGAVLPERSTVEWEYERLDRMCDWGQETGFDAFNAAQLRNYALRLYRGVQTVSLSHLQTDPVFPHHGYSFIHSSEWHDHFPGELRIHLDLTHAVSMYDVDLAPSLVGRRFVANDRREHRVLGIDQADIDRVRDRVSQIPMTSASKSGIDWMALFKVIRDQHAKRLQVLQGTLHEATSDSEDSAQRAFRIVLSILAPYLLHSAVPLLSSQDTTWAAPVYQLCATTHTSFAASIKSLLTPSERLLLNAAQETMREICRTLVGLWADGVQVLPRTFSKTMVHEWQAEVDRLVAWLDWDVWLTCQPACASDETCHLPGAPFFMHKWNVSVPRCLRLFEPYSPIDLDSSIQT